MFHRTGLHAPMQDGLHVFEWAKEHRACAFSPMSRRWRLNENSLVPSTLKQMANAKFPIVVCRFVGGREIDLVRSGLEEKKRSTYAQIWNRADGVDDQRSAAYVIALTRIEGIYEAIGT